LRTIQPLEKPRGFLFYHSGKNQKTTHSVVYAHAHDLVPKTKVLVSSADYSSKHFSSQMGGIQPTGTSGLK